MPEGGKAAAVYTMERLPFANQHTLQRKKDSLFLIHHQLPFIQTHAPCGARGRLFMSECVSLCVCQSERLGKWQADTPAHAHTRFWFSEVSHTGKFSAIGRMLMLSHLKVSPATVSSWRYEVSPPPAFVYCA